MAKEKKAPVKAESPPAPPPQQKTVTVGCPICTATGHVDGDKDNPFCPSCKGSGKITVPVEGSALCPRCEGEGEHRGMPCKPCASTGRVAGDKVAGEHAAKLAADYKQAAHAELEAKLAAEFERGRQSAFQEVAAAKDK